MGKPNSVFTADTFAFFRELGRNNRKEWMDANRERYRALVVEPFRALLEQLTPTVLRLDPQFDVRGRTGVNFSRINRDIRFAKDKSPYRTQMYLMFPSADAADGSGGQLYVGVSAEAVTCGFRIYSEGRDSRLARVAAPRAAQNPRWLAQQARRLARKYQSYWYSKEKGEWTQHHGWPIRPDDWKRIKGWIVRKKMKPAAATRVAFVGDVAKMFREVFPLWRFAGAVNWKR
jgi:uncharacterized protein (TIGR02453 family)